MHSSGDTKISLTYLSMLVHTRPRQIRPSELFEGVVDALVTGVVIVGTIALLVEGAKYSGYQDSYISNSDSSSSRSSPSPTKYQSTSTSGDNQCFSDFDCLVSQLCLKKPGQMQGICVQDASQTRLSGERDSVTSGFPRPIEPYSNSDCKDGGQWDIIYQACVGYLPSIN